MQARTWFPVQAIVLIFASLACSSPSDQGDWTRVVGLIDTAGAELDPLIVPDTIRAGVAFIATVTTFGNTGCIRPDRSQVRASGLQADITPYDSARSGLPPCLAGWEAYSRSVDLVFATPGAARVRLHGRGFTGDLTLEKAISVQP